MGSSDLAWFWWLLAAAGFLTLATWVQGRAARVLIALFGLLCAGLALLRFLQLLGVS